MKEKLTEEISTTPQRIIECVKEHHKVQIEYMATLRVKEVLLNESAESQ